MNANGSSLGRKGHAQRLPQCRVWRIQRKLCRVNGTIYPKMLYVFNRKVAGVEHNLRGSLGRCEVPRRAASQGATIKVNSQVEG